MLVRTVDPCALQSKFTVFLWMEVNAFVTHSACWEVLAGLSRMNKWAIFSTQSAVRKMLAFNLLFIFRPTLLTLIG
jgi:hypothetical protein